MATTFGRAENHDRSPFGECNPRVLAGTTKFGIPRQIDSQLMIGPNSITNSNEMIASECGSRRWRRSDHRYEACLLAATPFGEASVWEWMGKKAGKADDIVCVCGGHDTCHGDGWMGTWWLLNVHDDCQSSFCMLMTPSLPCVILSLKHLSLFSLTLSLSLSPLSLTHSLSLSKGPPLHLALFLFSFPFKTVGL